jgi:hypothetical protein
MPSVLLDQVSTSRLSRGLDGRWLILPRYTQPEAETKLLLEKPNLHLPSQPQPRIIAPGRELSVVETLD